MKLKCPNGCKPDCDTPFFYLGFNQPELGVLAYPNGQPSNRWVDGTVGISEEILGFIREGDDLPHCIDCLTEAEREKA